VLQTQTVALLQDESDALHREDTQITLPGLDVEGRCKTTWTVRLSEIGRDEAEVLTLPMKMCIDTQEGYKLRCPLGGG
jgi:hypothetical protein